MLKGLKMKKSRVLVIFQSYFLIMFCFLNIGHTSNQKINDLREEANLLYSKSQYLETEKIWERILEDRNKSDEDMRKAAFVYYQNGQYAKASKLYENIIENKKDTPSDLKNFLFAANKIADYEEFNEEFKQKLLDACVKVKSEKYNDQYDLRIVDKLEKIARVKKENVSVKKSTNLTSTKFIWVQ